MPPTAYDYLAKLEELHATIERTIDGLSQAALDWSPGPDLNSIAVLVVHICGSERYWLGDVVAREPSNRDRPAEFQTRGVGAAALIQRLKDATDYAAGVLQSMAADDLAAMRVVPRDGTERSVAACLNNVVAHTANHLGHIEVTRHWWEHQTGNEAGL